jgi:hypothetical protein
MAQSAYFMGKTTHDATSVMHKAVHPAAPKA